MSKLFALVVFVLVFASQSSFGHGDHQHELTKDDAGSVAKGYVDQLVTDSKLPKSWTASTVVTSDSRIIKGKSRWIVTFENSKESDASKKKLEVVMTPGGQFVSQQFSK
jgi:hypothetical protein